MMLDSVAFLAFQMPSLELLVICGMASLLPIAFAVWMNGWLGSVKDKNPDDEIAEQAKADKAHREAHGGHGHGHGNDHGHGHGHAHA